MVKRFILHLVLSFFLYQAKDHHDFLRIADDWIHYERDLYEICENHTYSIDG